MTVEQAQELSRLAGLWATARVRRALVIHGCGAPQETEVKVYANEREANNNFHLYVRTLIKAN